MSRHPAPYRLAASLLLALVASAGVRAASVPCALPTASLPAGTRPAAALGHCPLEGTPLIRAADACAANGGDILSSHGPQWIPHGAYDLNAAARSPVYAARDGCVAVAAPHWDADTGNTVIIRHAGGYYSIYGHLQEITVRVNAQVHAGDRIGTVGMTGASQCLAEHHLPPNLYFGVLRRAAADAGDAAPTSTARGWASIWARAASTPFQRIPVDTSGANAQTYLFLGDSNGDGVVQPDEFLRGLSCWQRPRHSVPAAPTNLRVE